MSNINCPFCQQELNIDPCGEMGCPNDKCKESAFLIGTKELWQELITTRKALDVAVDGLNEIQDKGEYVNPIDIAESVLEQITALEQKG